MLSGKCGKEDQSLIASDRPQRLLCDLCRLASPTPIRCANREAARSQSVHCLRFFSLRPLNTSATVIAQSATSSSASISAVMRFRVLPRSCRKSMSVSVSRRYFILSGCVLALRGHHATTALLTREYPIQECSRLVEALNSTSKAQQLLAFQLLSTASVMNSLRRRGPTIRSTSSMSSFGAITCVLVNACVISCVVYITLSEEMQ